MNARRLTPEILDSLPHSDPAAIASRRDLQRLHPLLDQHRLWIRWLRKTFPDSPPKTIADLGCGDAHLLAQILPRAFPQGGNGSRLLLVDLQPCLPCSTLDQFEKQNWKPEVISSDVSTWAKNTPPVDLIMTNLFLHHFENASLQKLFYDLSLITRFFAAAEPRRGFAGAIGSRLLRLICCHPVTLHDARVSVEAGFRYHELSALWPSSSSWRLQEQRSGLFTHFFSARRIP
ncbi:MAG: class I SAM-dependent methyltransferase [Verrucomicrobia bacterium]|nr:class I SAM-dependent methyltransferase [Verrucomicrobiota bacterium]